MKILFVAPWFPYPPVNGTKIRLYNLLRHLGRTHMITLLSFVRAGEIVDIQGLQGICHQVETVRCREFSPNRLKALAGFFSPKPRSIIDTYQPKIADRVAKSIDSFQPDLAIFSEWATAIYAPQNTTIPLLFEDLEVSILHDAWKSTPNPLLRFRRWMTWVKAFNFYRELANRFSAITAVSVAERSHVLGIAPSRPPVHVLPNGVDLELNRPGIAEPTWNKLIFSGAMTYSANYDAAQYFLAEIFPHVLSRIPDAHLSITGSLQDVNLEGLVLNDHVQLCGYVPDIRQKVASSWASIVPLRIGGGTRLKILESMALGTPVVSTPKGAEGLDVKHEENILIADAPEQFAAETVRVLRDPELRERLSQNGRKLVEEKYDWEIVGQKLEQICQSLL
ncbi:MAG: glycosyltransferase family 4 protein [Chloroflexota bacterium]